MNMTRENLYQIILEEYLKEENLTENWDDALKLLRKIKGDPDYDPRTDPGAASYEPDHDPDSEKGLPHTDTQTMSRPMKKDTPPEGREPGETYAMDMPAGAPPSTEDQIAALVTDMSPQEVQDIFQAVFEKLPGVEIYEPEDDEEPPSPYSGKAISQRKRQLGKKMGFEEVLDFEGLKELVRDVLRESAPYHDLTNEYPEGFVSLQKEIAQKIFAAGGRANEATMGVEPQEAEDLMAQLIREEGIQMTSDDYRNLMYDEAEELLDIQADNEDV